MDWKDISDKLVEYQASHAQFNKANEIHQRDRIEDLYVVWYGKIPNEVMVKVGHGMWIGIERDGYAHS